MKDLFWGQTSEYSLNWKAVVLMLEVGSNVKRPSGFGIASFSVEQLQLYCSCGCSYFVNEPFELPFSNSFLHFQNDSLLCGLGNKSKNPVNLLWNIRSDWLYTADSVQVARPCMSTVNLIIPADSSIRRSRNRKRPGCLGKAKRTQRFMSRNSNLCARRKRPEVREVR
ncbi:hypothetical protein HPP92_011375 [Vanilla planifolia]|uniref:Uncharacterized protein n=1 Tax=Vanilla planifolia TaxID=51239 RepID=A0A835R0K3_VANPL|nr:hypothetical protein HPP92_011375 [Vanilla planifolia]